jgi:hypothetical protein
VASGKLCISAKVNGRFDSAELAAIRAELIERSPDGVYSDPMSYGAGRAEFVSLIERFHQTRPGATFDLTSGIHEHHGFLRFQWRMRTTESACSSTRPA